MRLLAFSMIAVAYAAVGARAQAPSGSRAAATRCDSVLSAPTTDSALVRMEMVVLPFDATQHIDSAYRRLIAQGIRESFAVPQPLALDTYAPEWLPFLPLELPRKDYAMATLRSFYRVELHRDGRLTGPKAIGGVRHPQLDAAMLSAVATLDSDRVLPPLPDSGSPDSVELRITVTPGTVADVHSKVDIVHAPSAAEPLFILRLPVRIASAPLQQLRTPQFPHYPDAMRSSEVEGRVQAEFVVEPDGRIDMSSVHFLSATALPFAQAVLDFMPYARFSPLEIGGCAVRALTQMPFAFTLGR